MIYIDKLLSIIVSTKQHVLLSALSFKDSKTLSSLANSAASDLFVTENQARLTVKILNDNKQHFGELEADITAAISDPKWSRPFRVIEQVKKLYINRKIGENPVLTVEFTFSTNLRKILTQASKSLEGLIQDTNGKLYHAEFTERNIITLVELLQKQSFTIDDELVEHYNTIKSWDKNSVKQGYMHNTITTRNYESCIANDIGSFDSVSDDIKMDRSIRYRYYTDFELPDNGTLTRAIATRGKTRMWVNKKEHTLSDVVSSLVELKRAPVLVVFDNYNQHKLGTILEELSNALVENNLNDDVGIYFRLPNTDAGTKFNTLIANNQYNKFLSSNTKVVGVQSNKIPKFLLTTDWKPMSVIVIDTNLRSSKTAVYANGCDLIITYSDQEPLNEKTEKWA